MNLEEQSALYKQLHDSGQHEQAWQIYDEMAEQGLMLKYNPDDQTFSFVDAETYMNTPPGHNGKGS